MVDMGSLIQNQRSNLPQIFLFVGILSFQGRGEMRDAVRTYWAPTSGAVDGEQVAYKFILAQDDVDNETQIEMNQHGDIYTSDHPSGYHKVIYKTLRVLEVGTKFYNAKFVLKTDDDSFVNIPQLVQEIKSTCRNPSCEREKQYIGQFLKGAPVHVKEFGGWEIWDNKAYWERTGLAQYMYYAIGGGYVLSGDIALTVVLVQDTVGYMHNNIEDTSIGWWISGMNAEFVEKSFYDVTGPCCVIDMQNGPQLTVDPCRKERGTVFHKIPTVRDMRLMGEAYKICSASESQDNQDNKSQQEKESQDKVPQENTEQQTNESQDQVLQENLEQNVNSSSPNSGEQNLNSTSDLGIEQS